MKKLVFLGSVFMKEIKAKELTRAVLIKLSPHEWSQINLFGRAFSEIGHILIEADAKKRGIFIFGFWSGDPITWTETYGEPEESFEKMEERLSNILKNPSPNINRGIVWFNLMKLHGKTNLKCKSKEYWNSRGITPSSRNLDWEDEVFDLADEVPFLIEEQSYNRGWFRRKDGKVQWEEVYD